MTVGVIRFPPRRSAAIWILNHDGWLVVARSHAWLFGSLHEARDEARWLSRNLDLPVREAAR